MRRGAFIGVAAAAVAGAVAVSERQTLYRVARGCGTPPAAPPNAPNAKLTQFSFRSRVLNNSVGVARVDATPDAGIDESPALIIVLPGRGGTGYAQVAGLHLNDFLGAAVTKVARRPVTMLAVDGGESFWHPRHNGENRLQMLVDEVVRPQQTDLGATPQRTAIAGWSMGGYGAFLAAERYPSLFSCVCGVSVAVWQNAEQQEHAIPDAFDDANDFARHDIAAGVRALRGKAVRLACGDRDPFYENDRLLAARLREGGIDAELDWGSGCHDEWFWTRSAPRDFSFVVRSIAGS